MVTKRTIPEYMNTKEIAKMKKKLRSDDWEPRLSESTYGFVKQLFFLNNYVLLKNFIDKNSEYTGSYNKLSNIKNEISKNWSFIEEEEDLGIRKPRFRFNKENIAVRHILFEIYIRRDWKFLYKYLQNHPLENNSDVEKVYRDFCSITRDDNSFSGLLKSLLYPDFFAGYLRNPKLIPLFNENLSFKRCEAFLSDRDFIDELSTCAFLIEQKGFLEIFKEESKLPKNIDIFQLLSHLRPNNKTKALSRLSKQEEDISSVTPFESKLKIMNMCINRVKSPEKTDAPNGQIVSSEKLPSKNNQNTNISTFSVIGLLNHNFEENSYDTNY